MFKTSIEIDLQYSGAGSKCFDGGFLTLSKKRGTRQIFSGTLRRQSRGKYLAAMR